MRKTMLKAEKVILTFIIFVKPKNINNGFGLI